MPKSYNQLQDKIRQLQQKADDAKAKAAIYVIRQIREAVSFYSLTARDLGLEVSSGGATPPAGSTLKSFAPLVRPTGSKRTSSTAAKFMNSEGQVWGGRGPRPLWLREALLQGSGLSDFEVARTAPKKQSVATGEASQKERSASANGAHRRESAGPKTIRTGKGRGERKPMATAKTPHVAQDVPHSKASETLIPASETAESTTRTSTNTASRRKLMPTKAKPLLKTGFKRSLSPQHEAGIAEKGRDQPTAPSQLAQENHSVATSERKPSSRRPIVRSKKTKNSTKSTPTRRSSRKSVDAHSAAAVMSESPTTPAE